MAFVSIIFVASFYMMWVLSKNSRSGNVGERRVRNLLSHLDENVYKTLHDLTIRGPSLSSQIDHIVIGPAGIFVIETKNITGWISGSEKSQYWTQNIYGTKYQFFNPIKQNWGHVSAIKSTLPYNPNVTYYPIVVFVDRYKDVELQHIPTSLPVLYSSELIPYIERFSSSKALSKQQVGEIFQKLKSVDTLDTRSHVQYVKKKKRERNLQKASGLCQRCSKPLVLRKGKYGSFYGCAGYPSCQYTIGVDEYQS